MIGQFDLPEESTRYPPKISFKYFPPKSMTMQRDKNYFDFQAQHYYWKYQEWQHQTNDPELKRSNWWADNWEWNGKTL